jgi:hypothetical protein
MNKQEISQLKRRRVEKEEKMNNPMQKLLEKVKKLHRLKVKMLLLPLENTKRNMFN